MYYKTTSKAVQWNNSEPCVKNIKSETHPYILVWNTRQRKKKKKESKTKQKNYSPSEFIFYLYLAIESFADLIWYEVNSSLRDEITFENSSWLHLEGGDPKFIKYKWVNDFSFIITS